MAKQNYIDPQELWTELHNWQQDQSKQMSDKLGLMFIELCDHILRHRHFVGYKSEVKEDMKGFALQKLVRAAALVKIGDELNNETKKRMFNYLSCTVFNAYYTVLTKHYKQLNLQRDLLAQAIDDMRDLNPILADEIYQHNKDFIEYMQNK